MRYMLLIYGDESQMASMSEEEMGGVMDAYNKFTVDFEASGKMIGGEALLPTPTATVVQVQDGKTITTDGPFAETKEALGGYYAIDAADLDEAIAWAAKIPGAQSGSIEVRPIMEFE
ncbi:MAG: YciI family protein [SAR202 cluster bacterium]|nr:YciI family protein [SAR202 cluster bacterium]MDP6514287.1 YciI family protein [SAR202 cluster bacterium]